MAPIHSKPLSRGAIELLYYQDQKNANQRKQMMKLYQDAQSAIQRCEKVCEERDKALIERKRAYDERDRALQELSDVCKERESARKFQQRAIEAVFALIETKGPSKLNSGAAYEGEATHGAAPEIKAPKSLLDRSPTLIDLDKDFPTEQSHERTKSPAAILTQPRLTGPPQIIDEHCSSTKREPENFAESVQAPSFSPKSDAKTILPFNHHQHGNGRAYSGRMLIEDVTGVPDYARFAGAPDENFWRFGLRYRPGGSTQGFRKSVVVSNIPICATIADVLSQVRGGNIVSCVLTDTISITGSLSALIRFKEGEPAQAYADFVSTHPVLIKRQRVTAMLIQSPSYPLEKRTQANVYGRNLTRCLKIHKLSANVTESWIYLDLKMRFGPGEDPIEFIRTCNDGTIDISFSKVDIAGRAYGLLTNFTKYSGCSVRYIEDPCNGPLEQLLTKEYSQLIAKSNASFTGTRSNGQVHGQKALSDHDMKYESFDGRNKMINSDGMEWATPRPDTAGGGDYLQRARGSVAPAPKPGARDEPSILDYPNKTVNPVTEWLKEGVVLSAPQTDDSPSPVYDLRQKALKINPPMCESSPVVVGKPIVDLESQGVLTPKAKNSEYCVAETVMDMPLGFDSNKVPGLESSQEKLQTPSLCSDRTASPQSQAKEINAELAQDMEDKIWKTLPFTKDSATIVKGRQKKATTAHTRSDSFAALDPTINKNLSFFSTKTHDMSSELDSDSTMSSWVQVSDLHEKTRSNITLIDLGSS